MDQKPIAERSLGTTPLSAKPLISVDNSINIDG